MVACRENRKENAMRLIKHFSSECEDDWRRESGLVNELGEKEHPNILTYCWHCKGMYLGEFFLFFFSVSRNGLLLCVQFIFTTLNNSLLFLVPLRELSRELRVINYNLRKIVGMTNLSFRGEGAGSCALKVYEHRSTHGRKKTFIVRLFHAPAN